MTIDRTYYTFGHVREDVLQDNMNGDLVDTRLICIVLCR